MAGQAKMPMNSPQVTGTRRTWWTQVMVGLLAFFVVGATVSGECRAREFRLAIDIGHTPKSPGAVSARGVPEYLFNQRIATLLYKKIRQDKQFKGSFIINETGQTISLASRAAIAHRRGADLFLSIHHDSVETEDLSHWVYQGKVMPYCDKYAGYSVFYSEKNGRPLESLMFAMVIGTEMLRAGFCPTLHHAKKFTGGDKDLIDRTRGIYKYNQLIVLKNTTMPAVLFECGIIKSRKEELKLAQSRYQARLVEALFQAIQKYVKMTKANPDSQTVITPQ